MLGFFDRYEASGGISGGKLGGVSSVRPTYETDLIATFAPYSYDRMYLKAFTGCDYLTDHWDPVRTLGESSLLLYQNKYLDYRHFTTFLEAERLKDLRTITPNIFMARMDLTNVRANTEYLYTLYFACDEISLPFTNDNSIINGIFSIGHDATIYFYPPTTQNYDLLFPYSDSLSNNKSDYPFAAS